jgi:hypothetical protein
MGDVNIKSQEVASFGCDNINYFDKVNMHNEINPTMVCKDSINDWNHLIRNFSNDKKLYE